MMEPLTIENASITQTAMVLVISALASYSLTQIAKPVFKRRARVGSSLRRAALRTVAVVLGGSFGYLLAGHTSLGAIIGVGAGSLTTAVFAGMRSRIKAAASGRADF